ncbi:hypothetical protein CYMTET_34356, partial [Cymbomonas tetramitiformis]
EEKLRKVLIYVPGMTHLAPQLSQHGVDCKILADLTAQELHAMDVPIIKAKAFCQERDLRKLCKLCGVETVNKRLHDVSSVLSYIPGLSKHAKRLVIEEEMDKETLMMSSVQQLHMIGIPMGAAHRLRTFLKERDLPGLHDRI